MVFPGCNETTEGVDEAFSLHPSVEIFELHFRQVKPAIEAVLKSASQNTGSRRSAEDGNLLPMGPSLFFFLSVLGQAVTFLVKMRESRRGLDAKLCLANLVPAASHS
jgi:hypothetical protein